MLNSPIKRETGHLLKLALPLIGAQLAQMGMSVTDTIMAGRYGAADLAGVALAGSLMWPILLLSMGVVQAVTPTVAQLSGAQAYRDIGEVIRQGLWLALIGGIISVVLMNNVAPLYRIMQVDQEVVSISMGYLEMCSFGIPALMCYFCLRYLAEGMGHTRPALLIAGGALIVKIPLNYVLIYGEFGLPAAGGVGCGIATAIVMWVQLILIIIVVTRKRFRITGWTSQFSLPDWRRIRPLLRIGIPIGTTIFAELGFFSLTTLLLGRYGAEVIAAHNIAMNIGSIIFMIPLGLGMAATIRIGFRIGGAEVEGARTTAALTIACALLFAAFVAILILFFRQHLVGLYTSEVAVRELSTVLLLFVVFYFAFDSAQSTATGCLRGYKDTKVPMQIALFSYWMLGLPLQCILGFGWIGEPMGIYGFWSGLAIGLGVAALLLCYRLWRVCRSKSLILSLSH